MEETPYAAVFSAVNDLWPRRDRIKPEKPFALEVHADTSLIKLSWQKNLDADLKGYRIYRSLENDPSTFKLITRKVLKECLFSEPHPAGTGRKFLYRVAAIDRSGNESDFAQVSICIPDKLCPSSPKLEDVSFRNQIVFIRWKASPEKDIKGYWLYRQQDSIQDSVPLNKTLLPPSTVLYLDRTTYNNSSYAYSLVAVDSSGLISPRSSSIRIQIPSGEILGELITGLKAGYDSSRKAVTLSFRYKADINSIKGFIVLRSSDRNNYYPVSNVLKTPEFSDTALQKGAAYSYKVNILTAEGTLIEGRTIVRIKAD